MPKIRIQCSHCGHEARVPEQFRGKKVRCLRCHSKLRVPQDAECEGEAPPAKIPSRPRKKARREPSGGGRGPSSRTRREALSVLRELLHEYDHAIESIPRGLEIDLRGVAFGLARQLAEDMLESRAIRDVKLAGGTGECRIVVTLQGWEFNPEDSFADDDEDTEVFQRGPKAAGSWAPTGLLEPAVGVEDETDPGWGLDRNLPGDVPPESTAQSFFVDGSRSAGGEPVALYERARDLMDAGDPTEAVPLLERAVAADRNFARAVHLLGKAYASLGDYHRARRAFRHLTKLEGDDPESHVLYAAAAVRCDRLEEARRALMAAIKLDANHKQAYRYAAALWERLGDAERARKFRARYQALKLRG
ncbi:MAG: CDC27 family protein [Planctomycetes bacterium]|nr:CDC27 family protein [Planctomycetota bacterium]